MLINLEEDFKNFENYCQSYNDYKEKILNKISLENKIIYSTPIYDLVSFNSTPETDRVFLIIPSIINNSNIFTIGGKESFIGYLSSYGKVYLVNWKEPYEQTYDLNLNDYVKETSQIVENLHKTLNKNIDLIGYCLGGNFALATSVLISNCIKSLMLFATPWDFNYLKNFRHAQKILHIERALENLPVVPITYMQILFLLMDTEKSFNKFFCSYFLDSCNDINTFFEVEQWLYTGNDIAKPAYNQLMTELIDRNITMSNDWYIDENCINPTELKIPVLSVLGLKDKIVAADAVRAIYSMLSNYKPIEIDSGHIGFFVGKHKEKLYKEIDQWLRGNNE
ncbi:MAG: rutD 1 [Rickettsiaceae bacterium]|jgi:polyhydroxyalkanoate synthase|nr:rutD 1 [Rickettsiaceae bacterium]